MASSSSAFANSHYAPVSKSILDAGWEDWESAVAEQKQPQSVAGAATAASCALAASRAFSYQPPNPALLGGFPDEDESSVPSSAGSKEVTPNRDSVPKDAVTTKLPKTVPNRGYIPTADSILSGFEALSLCSDKIGKGKELEAKTQPKTGARSEPKNTENPVTPDVGARQSDMNAAFVRNQKNVAPADLPGYNVDAAVELGFGQRYQLAGETDAVVITNRRRLPEVQSGRQDCVVCTESKDARTEFPLAAVTRTCDHAPRTCLACVETSIRTDLSSRLWNEIKCPECGQLLQYDDVQRFADAETRERYQTLSFRYAISEAENFLWCTAGCGYGQVHDGGVAQPIVPCMLCAARSCFHHKVAWHENLTCDEYDALQADPANFRSRFEIENEAAEAEAALRRAQEDADRVFAQSLLAEEQQAVERDRIELEERKRIEREAREKKERGARERKARIAREQAARRKADEEASAKTVGKTTKPCPGCSSPIEKNAGCQHMTCTRCRFQFCWTCNQNWVGHSSWSCSPPRR